MSGFAGAFALDGRALDPADALVVDAMGAAIAHRGLAQRTIVRDGPLALAVPQRDGPPPSGTLAAIDGRLEASDLVARYRERGPDFCIGLAGRFALALWDSERRTLVLARDALGVRPLFYARVDGADGPLLVFASELKALLTHPRCPRAIDWTTALAHQAMPRKTFAVTSYFPGLEPLPRGGRLVADARGACAVEVVDALERPSADALADDHRSDAEVIDQFRNVFVAAVDAALGPDLEHAGLLLSGGIDSVSIAAVAARRARVPTFTVMSQSTWGNGDARLAHEAATLLQLPSHQVVVPWDEPMTPDAWRRIVWQCESPLCGPQHYYKLQLHRHARTVRPDLRLLLNGEGSDELMGADFRNHGEERDDATFDDYLADLAEKQRVDLHSLESLAIEGWMGRPVQSRAALANASGRPLPRHPWHRRLDYVLDGLDQDILWRDDRLAAGEGMTADAPYVDRHLCELILRLPTRLYADLFWHKRMLREAMRGIVPEPLRNAPKTPFFAGVDGRFTTRMLYAMLMADDRALVREALGDDGDHPELAPGLVDALLEDCARDPQRGSSQVLLTLVNLGLLERMAKDAAARPGPTSAIPALSSIDRWDEDAIVRRLAQAPVDIGLDTVLAFAPGVELVLKDRADSPTPTWYVVVNDAVRYVLDEPDTRAWCEVLRRVDGVRPLRAILAELDLALAEVSKHAAEALAFDVVVVA
ncbi:MAG: asparagine synthase-related protein [Myxococcota bacterium]